MSTTSIDINSEYLSLAYAAYGIQENIDNSQFLDKNTWEQLSVIYKAMEHLYIQ